MFGDRVSDAGMGKDSGKGAVYPEPCLSSRLVRSVCQADLGIWGGMLVSKGPSASNHSMLSGSIN